MRCRKNGKESKLWGNLSITYHQKRLRRVLIWFTWDVLANVKNNDLSTISNWLFFINTLNIFCRSEVIDFEFYSACSTTRSLRTVGNEIHWFQYFQLLPFKLLCCTLTVLQVSLVCQGSIIYLQYFISFCRNYFPGSYSTSSFRPKIYSEFLHSCYRTFFAPINKIWIHYCPSSMTNVNEISEQQASE